MTQYCFVVLSNPVAGREDEYNQWYDEKHLADVLAIPGFVAARRFRATKAGGKLPQKYLAIYEVDSDDVRKTLKDLYSRANTALMPISPALDMASVSTTLFEAITPRVTKR